MRALLVQLPHSERHPTMFPLGIGYIAAALQEVGCEVEFLDIFALGLSQQEVVAFLSKSKWDLVGVSAFSTQYAWAKWITFEARRLQPKALVVMGGPLPTFNAELVLARTGTDVCIISEGEETIKDLAGNIGNFNNVPGIAFRSTDNRVVHTMPRPYIRDLDKLPFVKYDIFSTDIYFRHLGLFGIPDFRMINMLTSRGCPYACHFCSRTFTGARFRSIDKIVEEIGLLRDTYNIRGVTFGDELVLANKERSYELCDKLKKLRIYWDCQGRANLVDLALLKTMKAAGCTSVGYGVESASQKILDNMNKRSTVKQNEEAIVNTLKAGMIPIVQMIYGYSGEDPDTIQETVNFFKRVHFYPPVARGACNFNLLTPLPGSRLYQDCLRSGKIVDEEQYLEKLDQGYYVNSPVRVNLTQFSDEELWAQKGRMSEKIKKDYDEYAQKHPWVFLGRYYRIVQSIWQISGPVELLKILMVKFARFVFRS